MDGNDQSISCVCGFEVVGPDVAGNVEALKVHPCPEAIRAAHPQTGRTWEVSTFSILGALAIIGIVILGLFAPASFWH